MAGEVSPTASTLKVCCKCGTILNGKKRMRDSEGRYWCVPCGQDDQRKKKSTTGTPCASCGQYFPEKKLVEYGRLKYCRRCFKKVTGTSAGFLSGLFAGGGGSGSGADTEKKRQRLLLVLLLLLGAISAFIHFNPFAE